MDKIVMSKLSKTWVLDLDGTLVLHNGYKLYGKDIFLTGAKEFLISIPPDDMIIFITSRKESEKQLTEDFLKVHNIRYNAIIYNAPYGERILLNDKKPSGLNTAIAINRERDFFDAIEVVIDENV